MKLPPLSANLCSPRSTAKSHLIHWFHLHHVLLHGQTLPTLCSIFFLILTHHIGFLTLSCLVWYSYHSWTAPFYILAFLHCPFYSLLNKLFCEKCYTEPVSWWTLWCAARFFSEMKNLVPATGSTASEKRSDVSLLCGCLSWRDLLCSKSRPLPKDGLHPVTIQCGYIKTSSVTKSGPLWRAIPASKLFMWLAETFAETWIASLSTAFWLLPLPIPASFNSLPHLLIPRTLHKKSLAW